MKLILHFTFLLYVLLQSITTAQPVNNLFAAQAETPITSEYEVLEVNVVVMCYNTLASFDACNDEESQFMADVITPNLNFQLKRDGFAALPWQSSRGNKNGLKKNDNNNNNNNRNLQSTCDLCLKTNSLYYCQQMSCCYKCRMLRIVRRIGAKVDLHEMGLQLNYASMSELGKLSDNRHLSDTCKAAVKDAVCDTQFPV